MSREGHEIYLVIANGSWTRTMPCHVSLQNFLADHGRDIVITNDKLDGKPLLENRRGAVLDFPVSGSGNEVKSIVPPHAIAFVTVAGS